MKTHAFVRTNLPRILGLNTNSVSGDTKSDQFPEFSKFVYFLFAPTLVYRDTYPRTAGPIKWKKIAISLGEISGCILYTYCLFDRYCVPVFRSIQVRKLSFVSYVELISICVMPGALMQLMGRHLILEI